MLKHLCITVRWHDSRYHGLLDRDGPGEWPPSPFRLLQALVAGVGRRGELDAAAGHALLWLEQQKPPTIIAPRSMPGQVVTRFVPNNDGDVEPDRQKRLTPKTARPTIMLDEPVVHYLWTDVGACPDAMPLAARAMTCLGWGIDMAFADARMVDDNEVEKLRGVRWHPRPGAVAEDGFLRAPVAGSVADLRRVYQSAISRIEGERLRLAEKPRVFERVVYSSAERPLGRPSVVFALRRDSDEWFRQPHATFMHVAAMLRHAAMEAMGGYPPDDVMDVAEWVNRFVGGHAERGDDGHAQFSYVPLPSVGHEHADAMVRRAMIIAPSGRDYWLAHLAEQLDGLELAPEGGTDAAILERIRPDGVARQYTAVCHQWATVTPAILPGHNDHKLAKTQKLIERALRESGIEQPCEFTWGAVPNFPHTLSAHKYDRHGRFCGYHRPAHLKDYTAVHLRLRFETPVAGPVVIGAGRHYGFGLCAKWESEL